MGQGAIKVVGAGLLMLGALALAVAAVVLLAGGDDVAPVVIVAPEPTAIPEQSLPRIRVHVSGAVMSPGVYEMNDGDRVLDAIAYAGGVQPNGDLASINLAQRVQDEAQYHIPQSGESAATHNSAPAQRAFIPSDRAPLAGGRASPTLIDLNTATARELELLPSIGPTMAERIIAYRETNGPFASIDDVENVPGIGPKTLESIRPMATVAGSP